ncbi:MAG: hypothetical protein ABI972_07060 [Acidobacteriota bacterium]
MRRLARRLGNRLLAALLCATLTLSLPAHSAGLAVFTGAARLTSTLKATSTHEICVPVSRERAQLPSGKLRDPHNDIVSLAAARPGVLPSAVLRRQSSQLTGEPRVRRHRLTVGRSPPQSSLAL